MTPTQPAMIPGPTLVIRPGALGDAILTLPALEALRAHGAQPLTLLGTPASWRFLPLGSTEIRLLDFSSAEWLGLFSDDAEVSTRAASLLAHTKLAIVYLSGATHDIERRLKKFGVEKVFVIAPPLASQNLSCPEAPTLQTAQWTESTLPPEHAARKLLDPLKAILPPNAGIENRVRGLDIFPSMQGRKCAEVFMESPRRAYGFNEMIALIPGSGGKAKCWPAAHFAKLAALIVNELHALPLVFFGPADSITREEFFDALAPKISSSSIDCRPLHEVFALLDQCKMAICNDSGMAHLAARATTTLALFGPTTPAKWAPVGQHVWTLQAPGNDMRALTVETVFALSARIIESQDKL